MGLTLIFLEIGSLIYYFLQEKSLFYTRGPRLGQLVEERDQTTDKLKDSLVERLHPYFGYTLKAGAFGDPKYGLKINNYGFFSTYNYPVIKTSDQQFIIGLIGGSVGTDLVNNDAINQRFTQSLKQLPQLADKQIIILNMGGLGYKQPQQLLILNYFLALGQKFDLIINIDGFNEVAFGSLNNQAKIDISMPSLQQIQPISSIANQSLSMETINTVAEINQIQADLKDAVKDADSCSLALCYTVKWIGVQQLVNNYRQAVAKYQALLVQPENLDRAKGDDSLFFLAKQDPILSPDEALSLIAKEWYRSSLLIHQILQQRNIPYIHVLQPNQYYPTQRVLTPEEQQIVKQPNPYANSIKQGYPKLISRLNDLAKSQVNVVNAVTIMDAEKGTVYRDQLGHYNSKGEEIFTNYISNQVKEVLITKLR